MLDSAVEINSESTSLGLGIEPGTVGRSAIRNALSLMVLGVCALGLGCHQNKTTRLGETRSPDGYWLATASTTQNFGPGAASVDTIVELKRTNGSEPAMEILAFSIGSLASQSGALNLTMKWASPSHLDVTYN